MDWKTLRLSLRSLSAYRGLLARDVMKCALALLDALCAENDEEAAACRAELFYRLRLDGQTKLSGWLLERLRFDEEPYPILVESGGSDLALEDAARRDVASLAELVSAVTDEKCEDLDFDSLTDFYRRHGAGVFAKYRAFVWEKGTLCPVEQPDAPEERELLGYERQREAVVNNTRAMLAGHAVNNVLLYGDSGTGKSATVKSLLAVEGLDDLRIIELQKDDLSGMSDLLPLLKNRRQKFILFIDDLAFDQDDKTYSMLKSILEGGLEPRPANVAIYATSNRRNLVRQTFSDRSGDEVDAAETVQEKTALADRFGLRVAYLPLNKAEFLALVDGLAAMEGVEMDAEQLHAEAVKWEARHPGRTPRTARQFIAGLKTYG